MTLIAFALGLVGCSVEPSQPSEAAVDASEAMPVDCGRWPHKSAEFDLCSRTPSMQRLTIYKPNVLDTTTGTLLNSEGELAEVSSAVVTMPDGSEAFMIMVDTLELRSRLRVYGSRPLIIAAHKEINISGELDVSGTESEPGPGANHAACQAGKGQDGADSVDGASGGGGGALHGLGGEGGRGAGGSVHGGAGGVPGVERRMYPYVCLAKIDLRGGCPGGQGGNEGGAGGHGGGAVALVAGVDVDVTGTIKATGHGGKAGGENGRGGGGGGSGGTIMFFTNDGPILRDTAILSANGGGGGGGGSPDDGQDGTLTTRGALGGRAGLGGGKGGGGNDILHWQGGPWGENGSSGSDGGGGGGGGGGGIITGTRFSGNQFNPPTVTPRDMYECF